jgi:serine protease AprX
MGCSVRTMRKGLVLARLITIFAIVAAAGPRASAQLNALNGLSKLDQLLQVHASLAGRSRIIVRASNPGLLRLLTPAVQLAGGTIVGSLPLVDSVVAEVPNAALAALGNNLLVAHISTDRLVVGAMERTGATIGAAAVRQELGYDGSGVGVAIIDSGAGATLDDLADSSDGASRIDQFVDFVNGGETPYDDYGHGSHVAGIVAGNGADSDGARSGIAPGARLIVLKVLDASGQGRISDVIAALNYAIAQKDALNIRVINLSIATGVYESYDDDPLTLAAKEAISAGIVVVAAAGNNGASPNGRLQYGGITAPGNAPWVLTVGASSHMGTVDRADDTIAAFSSRGPSALDDAAKPDLVAPGVGIESLSDPDSAFYVSRSGDLLSGTVPTSYLPYLSLSGTSMSAPVVSGTVALMLQANPALTPNEVKAILQYTAQPYAGYDRLTQGGGFLNAKGAVELARFLADPSGVAYPSTDGWSMQIIWGQRLVEGGQLSDDATAWPTSVVWGASTTASGNHITWGPGFGKTQNVVWGTRCGGNDCHFTWNLLDSGGAVSADDGDTVVWGTSDGDTVVWGTSCTDPRCDPIVWNRP